MGSTPYSPHTHAPLKEQLVILSLISGAQDQQGTSQPDLVDLRLGELPTPARAESWFCVHLKAIAPNILLWRHTVNIKRSDGEV